MNIERLKLTDEEKAIGKIVDDALVMEALIVLDLDETKVKAIKDWRQRQIEANFAVRNGTVRKILSLFKDFSSPEEVKKLVEAERERILGKDRPKIICLCGSTRFMEYFRCRARIETLAGKIVLTVSDISTYSSSTDPQKTDPETKRKLDELHLQKIDLADEVFVLNVGGYIGESTSREIAYAKEHNKPIKYLEALKGKK